jgi:hypothetical protein
VRRQNVAREPKVEAASGSSGETLALAAAALIREQGGKLGPVPRADLAKGVRDVTLDGEATRELRLESRRARVLSGESRRGDRNRCCVTRPVDYPE